jgi:hypothetical protein
MRRCKGTPVHYRVNPISPFLLDCRVQTLILYIPQLESFTFNGAWVSVPHTFLCWFLVNKIHTFYRCPEGSGFFSFCFVVDLLQFKINSYISENSYKFFDFTISRFRIGSGLQIFLWWLSEKIVFIRTMYK